VIELYKTVAEGDLQQAKELRKMWNYLLEVKENYIRRATMEHLMTADQLAEAELRLAKITGRIRAIDGKINYLLLGVGDPDSNMEHKSLKWYSDAKFGLEIRHLKDDLSKQRSRISDLIKSNYGYRYRLNGKGVPTLEEFAKTIFINKP
jgi:hypothetical protein